MNRRRTLLPFGLVLSSLLPAAGCLDHPLKQVELESEAQSLQSVQIDPRRKVDILFVIDNSGSMGEEQAALAQNFVAFVEQLERTEVDADYRIGITTTDNGNPWCAGTGPEGGALQLRSCRSHVDDFVFSPGTAGEVDRREEACLTYCPEELADLAPLPTTTDLDVEAKPRPWLQRGDGGTNVPEGVDTARALACWGPQGINGCGYESPLESMRKALLRSSTDGEAGQGFLRDDALLQVVFITDEADCSLGPAGPEAFDPEGDRALWPDTDAPIPPSAVCWNAGVACETGSDGVVRCDPADLDAQGLPAAPGDEVLQPLSRYFEVLHEIDQRKRELMGQDAPQVLVSVIAGVPSGYDGGELPYGPGDDPQFLDDFGTGAGCRSGNGQAVPPVRLRALAEEFTEEPGSNLFSICDEDYSPALESIAEILIPRLRPSCVDACVVGADTIEDGELSSCTVTRDSGGQSSRVPTCERQADGSFARPDGADLCVYAVTGDEIHDACAEAGLNVELRFVREQGVSFGDVTATCEVSVNPSLDCPGSVG